MTGTIEKALKLWGLEGSSVALVAERENKVYRVTHAGRDYALRLHRRGYRTDAEIWSELEWMTAVAEAGVDVPAPVVALSGARLEHVDDVQIDVLNWLEGQTLKLAISEADHHGRKALFYKLGQSLARLHSSCDRWVPPDGFSRVAWDRDGLVGDNPVWDRFWENPELSSEDRAMCVAFQDAAKNRLDGCAGQLDYGLIHADLVPDNVLVNQRGLSFIDFDDGGFGFRLFDVATTLLKNMELKGFADLKVALLDGYQSCRALDIRELDLFMALRAATYVGWNITRHNEPGGTERNTRFINTLRPLAEAVLS